MKNNNIVEEKDEIPFGRLDEEIQEEEKNRHLPTGENKKEEPKKEEKKVKKTLTKKILTLGLGLMALTGAIGGSSHLIQEQTTGNAAYQREVEKKYNQVSESLDRAMQIVPNYASLDNSNITQLVFDENEDDVNLSVYYEGRNDQLGIDRSGYAVFDVLMEYFEELVNAEESDNMLYYLDALQNIFDTMECVDAPFATEAMNLELLENNKDYANKFNNIFNVDDVKSDDVVRQVGFLPVRVELAEWKYDRETETYSYSYKITGVSYCETVDENQSNISDSDKLIMSGDYNKNKIKSYSREMIYSSSMYAPYGIDFKEVLKYDIDNIIKGENAPYTIETTYFEEVDLLEAFNQMQEGDFKFKKPENFDLKAYMEADEINALEEDDEYLD